MGHRQVGRRGAFVMRHGRWMVVAALAVVVAACAPPSPATSSTTTTTAGRSATTTAPSIPPTGAIDRQSRESVQRAYLDRLIPALAVASSWNGSVTGCNAGTTSNAHQDATANTVNFFRELVGLTPISFDANYSGKAQQAALMMQANSALDHSPPTAWTCFSPDGAQAAGSSNLALGTSNGPSAIRLYIADPGAGNTAVGHRRWILDPRRVTMGSGTTGTANALWVFGATQPLPVSPPVVAWPADGYFPVELEPSGRWSLSIPGAGFTDAAVTVADDLGTGYSVTKHPVATGYGQNTVAWQVNGLTYGDGQGARTFTVTVTGITGWTRSEHSYSIRMFDAA